MCYCMHYVITRHIQINLPVSTPTPQPPNLICHQISQLFGICPCIYISMYISTICHKYVRYYMAKNSAAFNNTLVSSTDFIQYVFQCWAISKKSGNPVCTRTLLTYRCDPWTTPCGSVTQCWWRWRNVVARLYRRTRLDCRAWWYYRYVR